MSAFGDAFKAARAAGKKEFTFNGKRYNTRTKDDEAKIAKKNTKAVSKDIERKRTARSNTPNTKMTVKAKRPSVGRQVARVGKDAAVAAARKPKAKAKPKAKVNLGENYKRMAKTPAGVPGKRAKPASKKVADAIRNPGMTDSDVDTSKPKPKKYGRNRGSVILNTPRARKPRGRLPR